MSGSEGLKEMSSERCSKFLFSWYETVNIWLVELVTTNEGDLRWYFILEAPENDCDYGMEGEVHETLGQADLDLKSGSTILITWVYTIYFMLYQEKVKLSWDLKDG